MTGRAAIACAVAVTGLEDACCITGPSATPLDTGDGSSRTALSLSISAPFAALMPAADGGRDVRTGAFLAVENEKA